MSISLKQVQKSSVQLFSPEEVEQAIKLLGSDISNDIGDKNPIILCVVIGGIYVTGKLLEHLKFPLRLNYIHATRYHGNTCGTEIKWKSKPTVDLNGEHILIIDDVLDGGITLEAISQYCLNQGAKSIKTAVLLDKPNNRHAQGLPHADFVGLETGNHYVYGCGLDFNNYLRNEPGIYAIHPEVLAEIEKKNAPLNEAELIA